MEDSASAAVERCMGVMDVLRPLIKKGIVELAYNDTARLDRATGMKKMEEALVAAGMKIDASITGNDETALGGDQGSWP